MSMFSSLPLSIDSLIAAAALSVWLPRRHMTALILLFGLFDAAASFAAPSLQLAPLALGAPAFLVLWGAAVMLGLFSTPAKSAPWVYVLPPLLAIDNLVVPANAVAAGIFSSLAAVTGFGLGSLVLRRSSDPRWIGGIAVGAGLLLAVQP